MGLIESLLVLSFTAAFVVVPYLWLKKRFGRGKDGPPLEGDGSRPISVAGLQHHQRTLDELFGDIRKKAQGRAAAAKNEHYVMPCAVELVLEPANKYDPFAVKVQLLERHVGYLPAALAPYFHALVKERHKKATRFRCKGKAFIPLRDGGDWQIEMDLPRLMR